MASFIIEGGHPLRGDITPQGAKNEALEVICASLLTADEVVIRNIPDIREVNNLISVAKETQDEYLALKKKVLAAQKQYPDLKNAYQEYKKTRQEAAAKVSAELENIAKDIDEGVLKKYKAKRAERIFPILCEIKSDRCSKCGMELSLADKETVSEGRVVECENCHRFLYKV